MSKNGEGRFVLLVRAYGDGLDQSAGMRWSVFRFATEKARKQAAAFFNKHDRDALTEFVDDWD